ncbi:MAG: beta-N-acetylhexosaminidase, partial [Nocardioidaceae bacterium]|nr:beta-N-acetylhexosaminidase [Nocardioidaceae bacterium]
GRLTNAADRVAALRRTWSPLAIRPDADDAINEGRRRSVEVATTLTAGAPRFAGPAAVIHIDTGTNPAVGVTPWGRLELGGETIDLIAADLPTTPSIGGELAIVVRRATAHPNVWAWIQQQLADNPLAVLIEMGWPDPALDAQPRVVRTLGCAAVLADALSSAMTGARRRANPVSSPT